MNISKKAMIPTALLLATIMMASAVCAQETTFANPSPAGSTGFLRPLGIAADTAGNIYVTTSFNSVWKFSPSGEVITKWGSAGNGEGQFDRPVNVAIDYQGFIYITDRDNARIQKFSSSGLFLSQWVCPWLRQNQASGRECFFPVRDLSGLATSPDGNVYFVMPNNYNIVKVTPEGTYMAEWKINTTKNRGASDYSDIAVDRAGNLFITDPTNNQVQKFSANGIYVTSFGSTGTGDGQFSKPYGISVDRDGFVYVTDTGLHRIQKFTNSGIFVTKWGSEGINDGEFSDPRDVAVDGNGNVYVTDFDTSCIQKFAGDGQFLTKWCGSLPTSRMISRITILPTVIPNPNRTPSERDDGISLNVSAYLKSVNENQHWGFSDTKISQYSEKMRRNPAKKYSIENTRIHISNFSQFSEDLKNTIGITEEQRLALVYDNQKEMGYRMAYMEIPGFRAPDTPHFVINGTVTDPEGRPLPDAVVKFESDLVAENTHLSATTRSGTDGRYHINVAWGDRQNASISKEGYVQNIHPEIKLTNESNTIDFLLTPLTRSTASSPGFCFFPVLGAIVLAWLIAARKPE